MVSLTHGYLPSGNLRCPHCHGVPPSTDGRTECGWCGPDHVPSVVPSVAPDLYDLYEQQVEQMRCDVEDMSVAELVEEVLHHRIRERSRP